MRRADRTSFIQEIGERLRDALGSPSAIFAHLRQSRPVPRSQCGIKTKTKGMKPSMQGDETVEIGQFGVECVADAFEAVERDAAHLGEAGDGGSLHVN